MILLVSGLVFTVLYIFLAARRIFKEYWFEKAIFSWG
jgi:ESS family glutamate:Na+ symporter